MAKDLKLTARLENKASKEIEKIIADLDRLAKTASESSARQATQTEANARRAIGSEERLARERIRIQRASAALADKQEQQEAARSKRADAKSLAKEQDLAEATLRIQRRAAIEEASLIENRFDRRIAIERVRHAQILADLKGNDKAIEAEIKRSTAVQNRIRMDKANLPNTPFQKLLGQVGASQNTMSMAASIGGVAAGATAAAAAIYGVSRAVGSVVDAGYRLDTIQRSLNFAAGGAKEGAKDFAFLSSEAKRLGFDVMAAATGFSQLSAAAKGTALEGKGAKDIFSSVSEASITLGLSADQTSGALNAIQQMISKGTVQSEELRGQLGERLPGAFQIAARAMGTTTQGLGKMLENGQVLADDFLPKFAAELHKTFGKAAEDASTKGQAAITKLNNRFTLLTATIGQDLVKAFGVGANALNDYLDFNEKLLGTITNINKEEQKRAQAQIYGYNAVAVASTAENDKLEEKKKKLLAAAKAQDDLNAKAHSATKTERETSSTAAYEAEATAREDARKKKEEEDKAEEDAAIDRENERLEKIRELRFQSKEAESKIRQKDEEDADRRVEETIALQTELAASRAQQIEGDFERQRAIADAHFAEVREHHQGNQEALTVIDQLESDRRKQIHKAEQAAKVAASIQFVGSIGQLMAALAGKNKALARAAQILNIGEAIANTAVGVTAALKIPPPLGFIQAASVAAAGAAQVATISSQRFATGTDYAPGGMALVGEQGPEMVYLPRGSQVKTAPETQKSFGGVTHSGNVVFNLTMPSGTTPSQARSMGAAMAGGYLERIKDHRRMDEEAEYYLGSRR